MIVLTCALGCQPTSEPTKAVPRLDPAPVSTITESIKFQALYVGSEEQADLTVEPSTLFEPTDPIIASVNTLGVANAATLTVRIIFQNGQVYGELKQTVRTTGPRITNFRFPRDTPWRIGLYTVEVDLDGKRQVRQPIEVVEQVPGRKSEQ